MRQKKTRQKGGFLGFSSFLPKGSSGRIFGGGGLKKRQRGGSILLDKFDNLRPIFNEQIKKITKRNSSRKDDIRFMRFKSKKKSKTNRQKGGKSISKARWVQQRYYNDW